MTKERGWLLGLGSALVVSLVLNVAFYESIRRLRSRVELITADKVYAPGEHFPTALGGVDARGRWTRFDVRASGKRSLVFLMSVECPACRDSFPAWKALAARVDPARWQVVWLSRDPWETLRDAVHAEDWPGTLLAGFACDVSRSLSLRFVPKVLVLEPDGRVARVWSGKQDEPGWAGLERFVLDGGGAVPPP